LREAHREGLNGLCFFFYRYLLTGNENVNGNVIETERERERELSQAFVA